MTVAASDGTTSNLVLDPLGHPGAAERAKHPRPSTSRGLHNLLVGVLVRGCRHDLWLQTPIFSLLRTVVTNYNLYQSKQKRHSQGPYTQEAKSPGKNFFYFKILKPIEVIGMWIKSH